jgi:phosphatidate cytidylyltransferase
MGVTFLVLAAVWLNDAAANLVGRAFGRIRPWTGISPNKSIEGCLAGLLASMLATLAIGSALCHLPVLAMLLLGAVIGVIVEVGDLCGSLIKRDLGLKDFGSALPGHGGVLDRFDSLVFAMPVAYYYLDYLLRPWF